jgi:hypothetical protein
MSSSTERVRRLRAKNGRIDAIVSKNDEDIIRRLGLILGMDQAGVIRRMIQDAREKYADELSKYESNESELDQLDMFMGG